MGASRIWLAYCLKIQYNKEDEMEVDNMADNNDKNKKSIDVTKPRVSTPASNIDASKVSDYTRREQQSLEKLVKKLGTNSGAKVRNEGNIKTKLSMAELARRLKIFSPIP